MKEYTEKIHAGRVLRMFLYRKNICKFCPAGAGYKSNTAITRWRNRCCIVCEDFVQVRGCPCHTLGKRKAVVVTAESLKTKGYITGKLAVKNLNDRVNYLIGGENIE